VDTSCRRLVLALASSSVLRSCKSCGLQHTSLSAAAAKTSAERRSMTNHIQQRQRTDDLPNNLKANSYCYCYYCLQLLSTLMTTDGRRRWNDGILGKLCMQEEYARENELVSFWFGSVWVLMLRWFGASLCRKIHSNFECLLLSAFCRLFLISLFFASYSYVTVYH